MYETPILLVTFNRPKHTSEVLAQIKLQQPRYLYVFQDGARDEIPEDREKCKAVRELINREVDWNCNLKTLYEEKNLGCGYGPVKAISWLFENEEQGIILEDDIVPSKDFFRFSVEMLIKYRDDNRIWMISGMNRMERWKPNCQSYVFTRLGNTWGWASYRRAWKYFDHDMITWFTGDGKAKINKIVGEKKFEAYEKDFDFHCSPERRNDVWDYHWHFARLYYSGLCVVPSVNLVSNIGFDQESTHTFGKDSSITTLKIIDLVFPLKNHSVKIDRIFDWVSFQRFGNPSHKTFVKRAGLKLIRLVFRNL